MALCKPQGASVDSLLEMLEQCLKLLREAVSFFMLPFDTANSV